MQNELQLKKLDITDLKNLIDLQDSIIKDLDADEQHFILHRTTEDFIKALKSDSTHVFGLYDGDKLVSQSILSMPTDNQKRELEEFMPDVKNSDIAIFKAVLVDPAYRGRGLMKEMLKIRETTAIMNNRRIAITQIAADNPASWVNAIQYGMQISKVGKDPDDGAEVIYLHKELVPSKNKRINLSDCYKFNLGSDVHKNMPVLFNKMQQLSDNGFRAFSWDKENNNLLWYKENHCSEPTIKKIFDTQAFVGISRS